MEIERQHGIVPFIATIKNGKQTLEMFVPGAMLKQGFNEQSVTSYIYSLNLVNVPILVLDNTSTIHIEWQYHTMKPKK